MTEGGHDSHEALVGTDTAAEMLPLPDDLELLVKLDMAVLENYLRCAFMLTLGWDEQLPQITMSPDAWAMSSSL